MAQFDPDNLRIARPSEVLGNIKVPFCKMCICSPFIEVFKRRNTETKQSLWTVTSYTDDPVNQSKLEADACSRHKARENAS